MPNLPSVQIVARKRAKVSAQHTASIGQKPIPCCSNCWHHDIGRDRLERRLCVRCNAFCIAGIMPQSQNAKDRHQRQRNDPCTKGRLLQGWTGPLETGSGGAPPESPAGSKLARHAARSGRLVENDGRAPGKEKYRGVVANKLAASDGRQRGRIPTAIPRDGHCDAGGWKLLAEEEAKLSGMRSKPGAQ